MEPNDPDCDPDAFNLDHDSEEEPFYTAHSLFNITKCYMFVFIVQSLFDGPDRNLPNIWINIIQIAIQIECLPGTKFLDQGRYPDNFAPCKQSI